MNSGKIFEEDFKKSMKVHNEIVAQGNDIAYDRLYVPQDTTKLGVRPICDFIVYSYPNIFYLELKSHKGKSLPLDSIRKNQYEGLLNKCNQQGVFPGVLVNLRMSDDEEAAFFIHISQVYDLRQDGKKSIPLKFLQEECIALPGRRNRTRYTYEVKYWLNQIARGYVNDRRHVPGDILE